MRLVIVSDAWRPQVNGVVRTLETLTAGLRAKDWEVRLITPDLFKTVPCPTYPEIRLALFPGRKIGSIIENFRPCAIHIATEGPLGMAARRYCVKKNLPFTTAYHTRFPEYIHARTRLSLSISYAVMQWFHGRSQSVMVATQTIEDELISMGFKNIRRWSRGVDLDLFKPRNKDFLSDPRPISLFVGRVSVEKNIEDFLSLDIPGTKYVVGDGPALKVLRKKYPDVVFAGVREGEELAQYVAAADVFVFPSRTDTFGLVLLEALASGVPVAAYPVPGPLDVINGSPAGILDENLKSAVARALVVPPSICREHASKFSWDNSIAQFESNLTVF
ncbi:MAG: alpha-mannosyltransferase [Rhodospirillaceae bacterium]|nr:alpha-mannosyltransferase [Rhodospirillaceae bacterium]